MKGEIMGVNSDPIEPPISRLEKMFPPDSQEKKEGAMRILYLMSMVSVPPLDQNNVLVRLEALQRITLGGTDTDYQIREQLLSVTDDLRRTIIRTHMSHIIGTLQVLIQRAEKT